jgi:hypothetical protein
MSTASSISGLRRLWAWCLQLAVCCASLGYVLFKLDFKVRYLTPADRPCHGQASNHPALTAGEVATIKQSENINPAENDTCWVCNHCTIHLDSCEPRSKVVDHLSTVYAPYFDCILVSHTIGRRNIVILMTFSSCLKSADHYAVFRL